METALRSPLIFSEVKMQPSRAVSIPISDIRQRSGFILSGLTASHALFHAFRQSLLVLLPNVRDAMGLTDVQATSITAIQEFASGMIDLPGGVAMDLLKRYWGLVMTLCTVAFGIGWLVIGLAPIYPVLLLGMAIVAAASSLWHLPVTAALSHRFAERRGFALSVHGTGGNIGDIVGPAVTGLFLAVLAWRGIITLYAVVPLLLTFVVFWAFRHIGDDNGEDDAATSLPEQLAYTRAMLKNGPLWGVIIVAGLRGMAFGSFTAIIALYAKDVLNLSGQTRGWYFGLLSLVGLASTPVLGHLSDRLGRKVVLIPGLLALCGLMVLMAWYGHQGGFLLLLVLIGVFLYSDQPILTAAALDCVGQRVTTTAIGFVSFSRLAMSAPSPVIAGWLYRPEAPQPVFYYIATIFAVSACVLWFIPLRPPAQGT
jgi:FSR family fosmidomycin resistance protein-like MFS transporter